MAQPHIVVFDSGVGGLSIVGHIRAIIPHCQLSYLADNAMFPYGLLEEQQLISRVSDLISNFASQFQPDVIVVGCNSASTLALPLLRQQLAIPIVGVVPAIKPAAAISSSNVIGLLATPGTIQRDYTDELINDYANHCEIIRVGSNQLVQAVEAKLRGSSIAPDLCQQVMAAFGEHPLWPQLDTIVLACTHFPLATHELAAAAPQVTHWVDSGEAIARRVSSLLKTSGVSENGNSTGDRAYFTDGTDLAPALQQQFNRYGFSQCLHWPRPQ